MFKRVYFPAKSRVPDAPKSVEDFLPPDFGLRDCLRSIPEGSNLGFWGLKTSILRSISDDFVDFAISDHKPSKIAFGAICLPRRKHRGAALYLPVARHRELQPRQRRLAPPRFPRRVDEIEREGLQLVDGGLAPERRGERRVGARGAELAARGAELELSLIHI